LLSAGSWDILGPLAVHEVLHQNYSPHSYPDYKRDERKVRTCNIEKTDRRSIEGKSNQCSD